MLLLVSIWSPGQVWNLRAKYNSVVMENMREHVTELENVCLYFCAVSMRKIYIHSKDHVTFGLVTIFGCLLSNQRARQDRLGEMTVYTSFSYHLFLTKFFESNQHKSINLCSP